MSTNANCSEIAYARCHNMKCYACDMRPHKEMCLLRK